MTRVAGIFGITLAVLSIGAVFHASVARSPRPEFSSFPTVEEKKAAFFEFLTPHVASANERVRAQRSRLLAIREAFAGGREPGWFDRRFLDRLADEYRVQADSTRALIDQLTLRVDIVPKSLALAQAAKESGWGTSRFARKANNFFGQWCFDPGCGMVPKERAGGASHEVRRFDTVSDSVASYIRNLNTHPGYRELRETRAVLRSNERRLTGLRLADELDRYSERGAQYVEEVKAMIRVNALEGRPATAQQVSGEASQS
jgi:Bax protein